MPKKGRFKRCSRILFCLGTDDSSSTGSVSPKEDPNHIRECKACQREQKKQRRKNFFKFWKKGQVLDLRCAQCALKATTGAQSENQADGDTAELDKESKAGTSEEEKESDPAWYQELDLCEDFGPRYSDSEDDNDWIFVVQADVHCEDWQGLPIEDPDQTNEDSETEQTSELSSTSAGPSQTFEQPSTSTELSGPSSGQNVEKPQINDNFVQKYVTDINEKNSGQNVEQPQITDDFIQKYVTDINEKNSGQNVEQPQITDFIHDRTSELSSTSAGPSQTFEQPSTSTELSGPSSGQNVEKPQITDNFVQKYVTDINEKNSGQNVEQPQITDNFIQKDVTAINEKNSDQNVEQPQITDNFVQKYVTDINEKNRKRIAETEVKYRKKKTPVPGHVSQGAQTSASIMMKLPEIENDKRKSVKKSDSEPMPSDEQQAPIYSVDPKPLFEPEPSYKIPENERLSAESAQEIFCKTETVNSEDRDHPKPHREPRRISRFTVVPVLSPELSADPKPRPEIKPSPEITESGGLPAQEVSNKTKTGAEEYRDHPKPSRESRHISKYTVVPVLSHEPSADPKPPPETEPSHTVPESVLSAEPAQAPNRTAIADSQGTEYHRDISKRRGEPRRISRFTVVPVLSPEPSADPKPPPETEPSPEITKAKVVSVEPSVDPITLPETKSSPEIVDTPIVESSVDPSPHLASESSPEIIENRSSMTESTREELSKNNRDAQKTHFGHVFPPMQAAMAAWYHTYVGETTNRLFNNTSIETQTFRLGAGLFQASANFLGRRFRDTGSLQELAKGNTKSTKEKSKEHADRTPVAAASSCSNEEKLTALGFSRSEANQALKSMDNNLERAAEWLFSGSNIDDLEVRPGARESGPKPLDLIPGNIQEIYNQRRIQPMSKEEYEHQLSEAALETEPDTKPALSSSTVASSSRHYANMVEQVNSVGAFFSDFDEEINPYATHGHTAIRNGEEEED